MKVYIDDVRDPKKYLTPELSDGIVWLKEWYEAKNFVLKNAEHIEVLHFDHFMPPARKTGSDIFHLVRLKAKRGKFPALKTIYVHSSDLGVITDLMQFKDSLAEIGIELINNRNRNR